MELLATTKCRFSSAGLQGEALFVPVLDTVIEEGDEHKPQTQLSAVLSFYFHLVKHLSAPSQKWLFARAAQVPVMELEDKSAIIRFLIHF